MNAGARDTPATGACCLPDGSCADTTEADCLLLGGEWHPGQECATFTCPPPPEEEMCREAKTIPAQTRAWSPNRCATFLAGPDIVRETPPMGTERRRLFAVRRLGLGDVMLATWPARMRGKQLPEGPADDRNWNPEVCKNFGGAVHQDETGGFMGIFGVEPESRHGSTARAYPCIFTQEMVDYLPAGTPIQAGDCAFVGGHQTPPVTEAWFHAQIDKCGEGRR